MWRRSAREAREQRELERQRLEDERWFLERTEAKRHERNGCLGWIVGLVSVVLTGVGIGIALAGGEGDGKTGKAMRPATAPDPETVLKPGATPPVLVEDVTPLESASGDGQLALGAALDMT